MNGLVGRRAEHEVVERVLVRARAGHSGALVVRGEAGIGKTALLEQARDGAEASGFRVESSVGVEAEAQFAFAGLHQLCGLLLGRLDQLPDPQQAALGVAFGLRAGAAPDRFLVGLAALTLVAAAAEEAPLLCLVDDAQWLDEASAQVLAFVARRVSAERVALLFGVRDADEGAVAPFAGLPELRLAGLDDTDARALLGAAVRAPLDEGVRDQVVAEARGNPLALLELPGTGPSAGLAGGFDLLSTAKVPHRVEDGFRRRSAGLPAESQLLLLLAAADPTGEAALLWRAATFLGIDRDAAAPAQEAGLFEVAARVRFRHPLVRSAVYRAATAPDRRRAHGALAAATDPRVDPDRRAWHRSLAVLGRDEDAAADLVRSAERARARGGLAAAAAFLQRAVDLTPDPTDRALRAVDAAGAMLAAGASDSALELLASAPTERLDMLSRTRLELLRARITFHTARGSTVPGMLVGAARTLTPLDAALARDTYLDAMDAALVTGGGEALRVATAALAAPPAARPPRPSDLLLDGLVTMFTRGYGAGAPALAPALVAVRDEANTTAGREDGRERRLWLAGRLAMGVLDDDLAHALTGRHVRLARETGSLETLPAALSLHSTVLVLAGEIDRADGLAVESAAIAEATGAVPLRSGGLVMLAAWRGDLPRTAHLTDITLADPANPDAGCEVAAARYAMAVLYNGLGRYDDARAAAGHACATDEPVIVSVGLPELVEATVRAGHPASAARTMEQLEQRASACGTSWALGLAARCRALTTAGSVAEDNYREAIDQLGRSRMTAETARAHLLYGEWLRREGRRRDARDQLRTAHGLLSDMGATAFAERAARELRATGDHPRERAAQPTDALTAQEAQVARAVATGATSREVAAELFLSPRTVEAHLRSIFRKLGITSRRQLRVLRLS